MNSLEHFVEGYEDTSIHFQSKDDLHVNRFIILCFFMISDQKYFILLMTPE